MVAAQLVNKASAGLCMGSQVQQWSMPPSWCTAWPCLARGRQQWTVRTSWAGDVLVLHPARYLEHSAQCLQSCQQRCVAWGAELLGEAACCLWACEWAGSIHITLVLSCNVSNLPFPRHGAGACHTHAVVCSGAAEQQHMGA
jgi:hypothetical protein